MVCWGLLIHDLCWGQQDGCSYQAQPFPSRHWHFFNGKTYVFLKVYPGKTYVFLKGISHFWETTMCWIFRATRIFAMDQFLHIILQQSRLSFLSAPLLFSMTPTPAGFSDWGDITERLACVLMCLWAPFCPSKRVEKDEKGWRKVTKNNLKDVDIFIDLHWSALTILIPSDKLT